MNTFAWSIALQWTNTNTFSNNQIKSDQITHSIITRNTFIIASIVSRAFVSIIALNTRKIKINSEKMRLKRNWPWDQRLRCDVNKRQSCTRQPYTDSYLTIKQNSIFELLQLRRRLRYQHRIALHCRICKYTYQHNDRKRYTEWSQKWNKVWRIFNESPNRIWNIDLPYRRKCTCRYRRISHRGPPLHLDKNPIDLSTKYSID